MASRYLTELFALMRNSHSYKKDGSWNSNPDEEKLLSRRHSGSDEEIELMGECLVPPDWYDIVENTKFILTKLDSKLRELETLYKKLGTRPDFFDQKNDDEARTSALVDEIKKLINTAFKNINILKSHASSSRRPIERKLIGNIVQGLVASLNEITSNFRDEQSNYFKQISSIQETANDFFDWDMDSSSTAGANSRADRTSVDSFDNFLKPSNTTTTYNASQLDDMISDVNLDEHFQRRPNQRSGDQLLMMKHDEKQMEAREREVQGIVQSIMELNQIYKDLSHLVHEQGTILDRIDYNVEATQTRVYEGYKQLKKAEQYQRANRKMYCIFMLSCTTLFLLILLILTKF